MKSVRLFLKSTFSEDKGDYLLSLTALGQFFLIALQNFLIDSGIYSEETAGTLRVFGTALLVVLSIYWVIKRSAIALVCCYSILILLFFLSSAINSDNLEYILSDGVRITLCTVVPIFLSFISIKNISTFFRSALFISLATAVVGLLYLCFSLSEMLPEKDPYSMSMGYSLLFPSLFLYYTKRPFFVLISIFLFIAIFLVGSRGPLIPIVCYILLDNVLNSSLFKSFVFLIFLIFFVCTIYYSPLLFVDMFDMLGLKSRTLVLLINGDINSDSGRGDIYNVMIDKLSESPYIGYGLFGDRVIGDGSYCHNIFLELMVDFGCFIPIVFLLIFSTALVLILPKFKKNEFMFFVLLLLSSIFPLCLSSSYLIDFRFPLFIGFLCVMIKKYLSIRIDGMFCNSICKTDCS